MELSLSVPYGLYNTFVISYLMQVSCHLFPFSFFLFFFLISFSIFRYFFFFFPCLSSEIYIYLGLFFDISYFCLFLYALDLLRFIPGFTYPPLLCVFGAIVSTGYLFILLFSSIPSLFFLPLSTDFIHYITPPLGLTLKSILLYIQRLIYFLSSFLPSFLTSSFYLHPDNPRSLIFFSFYLSFFFSFFLFSFSPPSPPPLVPFSHVLILPRPVIL